jgi:hypothetical protein
MLSSLKNYFSRSATVGTVSGTVVLRRKAAAASGSGLTVLFYAAFASAPSAAAAVATYEKTVDSIGGRGENNCTDNDIFHSYPLFPCRL